MSTEHKCALINSYSFMATLNSNLGILILLMEI